MGKPGRPPKLKEDPAITIAILQKDNRLLEQRCQELMKERDGAKDDAQLWLDGMTRRAEQVREMTEVIQRMNGWQDLARELLHELPLLRSVAPGV